VRPPNVPRSPLVSTVVSGYGQAGERQRLGHTSAILLLDNSTLERDKGHEDQLFPDMLMFAVKEGPGAGEIELER